MKLWDFKKRFKRHVEEVYSSHEDRLAFLESMCVGRARDVVAGLSCLVCSEEAYARAWERLEKRFGETSKLMNRLRQELLDGPSIKEGDAEAMLRLSDKMYRCEISFQGWNKGWMLNSQDLMYSLFERLPYRIKSQFVGQSTDSGHGSFKDLRLLIEKAAAEAESEFGRLLHKMKDNKIGNQARLTNRKGPVANQRVCAAQQATSEVVSRSQDKRQCVLCEDNHFLWQCEKFKGQSIKERKAVVKEHS